MWTNSQHRSQKANRESKKDSQTQNLYASSPVAEVQYKLKWTESMEITTITAPLSKENLRGTAWGLTNNNNWSTRRAKPIKKVYSILSLEKQSQLI